jgi:hypothetical protein
MHEPPILLKNRLNIKQEIVGTTNRLLFYMTRTEQKTTSTTIFDAAGTSLPSCYLATIRGYTDNPTDTRPTILLLLSVLVATGTFLPSHCLATE